MSLGTRYYRFCATRRGQHVARRLVQTLRCAGLLRATCLPLDCLALPHDAVRGLMQLWQRIHWSTSDGMMPARQLLAMYRLAVTTAVRGDIVELGAWTGLTTCYLATACRVRHDGHVYAVDSFAGHRENNTRYASIEKFHGSTRAAFDRRVDRAALTHWITALPGLTHEVVHAYPGGPIRMLLIDADHSYDGVRQDFELWSPLVAPGGLVVFHDYDMPAVARFVDEKVIGHPDFEDDPGEVAQNVIAFRRRCPVSAPLRSAVPARGAG